LKSIANIEKVDNRRPDGRIIALAAQVMKKGGVVIFPTQGLYGLGVAAHNDQAVAGLFALKGRPADKPLLVLIHKRDQLTTLVSRVDAVSAFLMDRFWPGRITFVLPAQPGLAPGLVSADGKIGVRLAGHPVAAALVVAVGGPITGTSANLSGSGGCATIADIGAPVLSQADLVLDAGPLDGIGSTVVDATGASPLILRVGAISAECVMAAFREFAGTQP
jgi:L-threonylcarbamoyladenylate synthase